MPPRRVEEEQRSGGDVPEVIAPLAASVAPSRLTPTLPGRGRMPISWRWWTPWTRIAGPLFLAALALVAVLTWGPLDKLLAFTDLFPFTELNPAKWLPATLGVWNTAWVGGGDIQYGGGYLLLSALEWPVLALGVPPAVVERGSYALLYIGMALSAYALPRTLGITSRVLPRLLGSIAYVFGLGHAMTTPSSLVDASFLLATLVPSLYARVLRDTGWTALRSTCLLILAAQLLAYVFNNPPQSVITLAQVVPICVYLLIQERQRTRVLAKTLGVVLATLLASLWWIVPAYIVSFNTSVQMVATTNVTSWSWTHAHASLLNVWRFTSSWAWPHPEYMPWASFFQPAALQVAQLWPLVAIGGALLLVGRGGTKLSTAVLFWGGMAVLAAFLSKGLHPPLTAVNLWIYEHVPGFFLFREPTDKFSGPLALASAMLLVLALTRIQRSRARRAARAAVIVSAAAVVGAIAVPFVDGQITANSPARIGLIQVAIPAYWTAMAGYVNDLPTNGGIAVLPNDDFYEMFYDWGFYGVDALPEVIFNRPVFFLRDTPNFYSTAAADLQTRDEELVQQLHAGDTNNLPAVLGSQSVRYVLLRRDIKWEVQSRNTISPLRLAALLKQTQGITLLRTIGELDLYQIDPSLVRERIYAVSAGEVVVHPNADAAMVAASALDGTVVSSAPPPACADVPSGDPAPTAPVVTVLARDRDGYTLRITVPKAPTLLVLNQSFNPSWGATVTATSTSGIQGCTNGRPAHVRAEGFANAWWLNVPGTSIVRISFGPQRRIDAAEAVSVVTLSAALLVLCVLAVRGLASARWALLPRADANAQEHAR